jgi:hypothetical protein
VSHPAPVMAAAPVERVACVSHPAPVMAAAPVEQVACVSRPPQRFRKFGVFSDD